jgi:ferritin-like metal-binding protein YciE
MITTQSEHTMELDTLQALYIDKLRDLYSAEQQILKAMPKIRKACTHDELQEAFDTHQAQTEQQVQRLERIFEELGVAPKGKHCKGMEGLIAEANELLGEDAAADVLDAGIIASAQSVEHYEIAGYGTARTYAELLGFDDHSELLQQTLNEEEETDRILTEIAMTSVNIEAMDGDDEDAEESEETTTAKSASGRGGAKNASTGAARKSPAKKSSRGRKS